MAICPDIRPNLYIFGLLSIVPLITAKGQMRPGVEMDLRVHLQSASVMVPVWI